ncbi:ABC transporter ATP-binding protein [Demequina sp. NBRC 110053]|uniref:ABC transporter ATP-binding protein n=1 Tax=Demequina sp. NBRC 110053 TaxID=1570342 RepID=UPI000A05CA23|nr:ABC transporter ATP-binding protein [Demequina sp. NBRC 110053]
MTAAIHATGLVKAFGDHTVLAGVDLTARRGHVTALLGSNGAGKTTTLNILTTAMRADGGTALVAGHDVATDRREVRRAIAVTGQAATVDGLLTAAENLELIGRLRGLSRAAARAKAAELVAASGLEDAARRQVSTYSGGMRRRLDLALSMVTPAQVVFLDEPTTGLDTRARNALWGQVRGLARDGAAVLLTTQYLEEADALADQVHVLHQGRVVATGTPRQLKERIGAAEVVVMTDGGVELAREATDGSADGVRRALDALEARGAVAAGARIDVRRPTLDDAFLALTEEAA